MKWLWSPSLCPHTSHGTDVAGTGTKSPRCDFCKVYMSIPHTLEYTYSIPTPTPASPTAVATINGVSPLDPWFLNTQAAPALDAVKVEEEEDEVTGLDTGNLVNQGGTRAARTGVPPYYLNAADPSAPPPPVTPTLASAPTTRTEAAARMKAQALPVLLQQRCCRLRRSDASSAARRC